MVIHHISHFPVLQEILILSISDNVLAFGDIALNRSTYQLTGPENPEGIRLAGKEYQMLEMLMSNPGQVISPDLFMD